MGAIVARFLLRYASAELLGRLLASPVGHKLIDAVFDQVAKLAAKSENDIDDAAVEFVRAMTHKVLDGDVI